MGKWRVAEAKQRFSQVVRAAAHEPQQILNRDRLVAAVVDAESLRAFEAWRAGQRRPIGEAFAELRRICAEEGYTLEAGSRRNRRNPLPRILARLSR